MALSTMGARTDPSIRLAALHLACSRRTVGGVQHPTTPSMRMPIYALMHTRIFYARGSLLPALLLSLAGGLPLLLTRSCYPPATPVPASLSTALGHAPTSSTIGVTCNVSACKVCGVQAAFVLRQRQRETRHSADFSDTFACSVRERVFVEKFSLDLFIPPLQTWACDCMSEAQQFLDNKGIIDFSGEHLTTPFYNRPLSTARNTI